MVCNMKTLTQDNLFKHLNIIDPELISFIQDNMLNLKTVKYTNYIFYFNDKGENIFQQGLNSTYFGVNNELIWKVLKERFNYLFHEISELIKSIVEYCYNLKNILPMIGITN